MKSKHLALVTALGLSLTSLAVAQTNATAANQPATEADAEAAAIAASNQPAATAAANEMSEMGATNQSESAAPMGSNAVSTAGAPASHQTPGAAAGNESATNATNVVNIPLVQFQDVPLTTAIESLARQANINYLLDPNIRYGQPDKNGQITPEPTLTIRWENITARDALLALLDNYGLQLIENPKTQIARIAIKNPNAPPPLITKIVQLKYASVSNMVEAVRSVLSDKRSRVLPDARTSQLVVVATDPEQDDVAKLVDQLDKPTRQVLIETRFMEVSSNPQTAKGVDWSGTLSAQNIAFGNGSLSGTTTITSPGSPVATTTTLPNGRSVSTTSTPGSAVSSVLNYVTGAGGFSMDTSSGFSPSTAFLNADGVKAVLSFLNQDSDAQVVATPRVVTLDNQMAHIEVTRAVPVFNTTAGTQGSPGGSQVAYTNLGTILDVTPRISANDYIWLTVEPEVSDVFDTVTKIVAGVENQADEYDIRRVITQVLIPNSNTLVMGGFIKDDTKNQYTKVPLLGDIPILGYAFRHENKELDKDNLLIFITPTIVTTNDYQPSTTAFLQSNPTGPQPAMNPQSIWDGAKPYDWSNPNKTDPYMNVINRDTALSMSAPVANESSASMDTNIPPDLTNAVPVSKSAAGVSPGVATPYVPPPSAPPVSAINALQQYESSGNVPPNANMPATPTETATNAPESQ
jgi:type II secretory pathway component GspD/PulD (secretin)